MARNLDGKDTLVTLTATKGMRARSDDLRNGSALFKKLLRQPGPILSEAGLVRGVKYHLVLQNHDTKTGKEIDPVFRRVELNRDGRPTRQFALIHEEDEHNIDDRTFEWYAQIITTYLTGDALTIPSTTMASMLQIALGLIACAEYLGSVAKVAKDIDNALLSRGKHLYLAIPNSPYIWVDLGFRISSKPIYREALIYIVGQRQLSMQISDQSSEMVSSRTYLDGLQPEVKQLALKKSKQLLAKCQSVDAQLMAYYLPDLERRSGTGRADRDEIGRQSYSNDIYGWQAVNIFRHFIGQALAYGETHAGDRYGYEFYKKIHAGGPTYLGREDMASFHDRFPMSTKAKNALYARLEEVKAAASQIVSPLFVNESYLEPSESRVVFPCFTCTYIDSVEYPWLYNWTNGSVQKSSASQPKGIRSPEPIQTKRAWLNSLYPDEPGIDFEREVEEFNQELQYDHVGTHEGSVEPSYEHINEDEGKIEPGYDFTNDEEFDSEPDETKELEESYIHAQRAIRPRMDQSMIIL